MTVVITTPSPRCQSASSVPSTHEKRAPGDRETVSQPTAVTVELLTRACTAWQDLAAQTGPLWNEWRRLWDGLAPHERDPATHPAWQSAWLAQHADSTRDIRIAVCRAGTRLLAVIPLEVAAGAARTSRCILIVPEDVPLEGASLAVSRDELSRVLDALLRTPVDGRTASLIEFARVDASHAVLAQRGLTCRIEAEGARSVIELPADSGALWEALGSNLKGNLRRASNKWQKFSDARIDELTGESGLTSGLMRLADVESRSWKADHGTDLGTDAHVREFFQRAVLPLAAENCAVVHVLVADGRDIGALLSVQFESELLLQKIAFDANYAECSPGNLLLQHVLEDYGPRSGARRINFVTCQPWHERWKPQQATTYRVQVFPRGVRGLWSRACIVPPRRRLRNWLNRAGLLDKIRSWRTLLPESRKAVNPSTE